MLHLLGRGIQPEWNDEKHDRDEVFAFLCYRGLHYAKTVYINEMNLIGVAPFNISFSYGRALLHSCLKGWLGSNEEAGQSALIARAKANSEAARGLYVPGSQPSSDEQLFVAGYTY